MFLNTVMCMPPRQFCDNPTSLLHFLSFCLSIYICILYIHFLCPFPYSSGLILNVILSLIYTKLQHYIRKIREKAAHKCSLVSSLIFACVVGNLIVLGLQRSTKQSKLPLGIGVPQPSSTPTTPKSSLCFHASTRIGTFQFNDCSSCSYFIHTYILFTYASIHMYTMERQLHLYILTHQNIFT